MMTEDEIRQFVNDTDDPDAIAARWLQDRAQLAEDVREYQTLFDLQFRRTQEATKLWRAEDPTARALTTPDLGKLLEWLMSGR